MTSTQIAAIRHRARWRIVATVGLPVLAVLLVVALAIMSAVTDVTANTFGVVDCFSTQVAGVQRGTHTSTTSGTDAVAIAAVDPAAAVVFAAVRSDAADPGDALVRVELASATSVEITRATDTATPPAVAVEWTVVEYACGVRVQRGTIAGDGTSTTHDVAIDAVDPDHSFALWTATPDAAATAFDADDLWRANVVDPTTLRLRSGAAAPPGATLAWQVVEFELHDAAAVQQINGTVGANAASVDLAVPTPVDPDRTLVLAGYTTGATGAGLSDRMLRAELTDGSTLRLTRTAAPSTLTVSAFVVELADGTTVQSGSISLAPTEASGTASVTGIDTARSTVLSTVLGPGGASWGETDHAASAVAGEAQATFRLAAEDTVHVERGTTASTSVFTYQAVTWGGPEWWDPSWAQRRQIRVDTTTAAPDGYTVPVTIDHADLVATGQALASGDDVRIVYHDGTTWSELDRVLAEGSSWNSATTTLEFRTRQPVAADSRDGSYWLHLSNPSAGAAPDDERAVYALADDFEDGTLGQFTQAGSSGAWYAAEPWTRRVPLTIPSGSVDADLTDFPVLVSLTDAGLATSAQADGSDLRFTAADGTTQLAHELVAFDAGSGALEAWVEVPTVSAGADTALWLYSGSGNAPAQEDVRATWSNDFVGVWHLSDDPAGSLPHAEDASPEGRDGVAVGAMTAGDQVAGRVGGGLDLDGTDDGIRVGDVATTGQGLTVSAWVRPDATSGDPVVVGRSDAGGAGTSWALGLDATSTSTADVELTVDLEGTPTTVAAGQVATGAWHHVAGVFDGASARTFADGAQAGGTVTSGHLTQTAGHEARLGQTASGSRALDGALDEVRVAGVARSAAWLAAEMLIDVTDTDLRDGALASGDDIVVTAADGVTRLDHEVESYDGATGHLVAWVRVPTVAAGADTDLFLYWGNTSAEDWQDPEGTFANDFRSVHHLAESPGG